MKDFSDITHRVTHYYRRPSTDQGWITTHFITRQDEDKENYYFGLTNEVFDKEKLEQDIENRSLQEIPSPTVIRKGQTVFIGREQSVYVGDIRKPLNEKLKKIYRDHLPTPMGDFEVTAIVNHVLGKKDLIHQKKALERYITYDSWTVVIRILLINIKMGFLSKNQLEATGYLFFLAQKKFTKKFDELLNKMDAALTTEGLSYFDDQGKSRDLVISVFDNIPYQDFIQDYENYEPIVEDLEELEDAA